MSTYFNPKSISGFDSAATSSVLTKGSENTIEFKPLSAISQNVQSNWNETNSGSPSYILNKPTIPTVPTNVSSFTNDANYITSAVTAMTNYATSANVVTALNNKVDKINGKGLSTNDFDNAYKGKLDGIASGAEVNVQADWSVTATTSDAYIKNKPTIPTVPTNVSSFTNDANYITSAVTAMTNYATSANTVSALNNKVDKINGKGLSTNDFDNAYKGKLDNIASGAEVNVQADWSVTATTSDAYIKNKPEIPAAANSGVLTITQNSVTIGTFSANEESAKTINIESQVLYEEIAYSDLVTKIVNQELVPGQQYRITDYLTITNNDNTVTPTYVGEYKSIRHPFDLVVTATSDCTLDYKAMALNSSRDTGAYFSNSNLSKWQIWYDINNDEEYYTWADSTNGKGVIYRMIDENGNDCPYDFKNIMFVRPINNGSYDPVNGTFTWVYTFDEYGQDGSLIFNSVISCNTIKPYFYDSDWDGDNELLLNDIVLLGYCQSNTFGLCCFNNTFIGNCSNNTFGNDCQSNTFGYYCHDNTFGYYCHDNNFGDYCQDNNFGDYCQGNNFGDRCNNNTFGNSCNHITFGNSSNQGGTYCRYNIVENGNQYIRLYQTSGTPGNNNQLQNVYIAQGVNRTTTWLDISTIARNLKYRTTVEKNSSGVLKIYNEADSAIIHTLTNQDIGKFVTVSSALTYELVSIPNANTTQY